MPIIPTLLLGDPGLMGHRLDHVVAVEVLQRLERSRSTTRAAGAAHVHVDDVNPIRLARAAIRSPARRLRVPVAGVLDQVRRGRVVARWIGWGVETLGVDTSVGAWTE